MRFWPGQDLTSQPIFFELQPDVLEKELKTHPWIRIATVKRQLLSTVSIKIEEQEPLAIVTIENLADIVINAQGAPFKEYEPAKDNLKALPVISGVDLTLSNSTYLFEGDLFNAVMEILKIKGFGQLQTIFGDENTGILINILNTHPNTGVTENPGETESENITVLPVKLGFDRFEKKTCKGQADSTLYGNKLSGQNHICHRSFQPGKGVCYD